MKISWATGLVVLLASSEAVGASSWWSKAVYNRWHETELERWLSDHDIPYPTPADRRDLEKLVKDNWHAKVQLPLAHTTQKTEDAFGDVKEWIFDTWSDSQLKTFLDKHGIPAPQPRKRDTLLSSARQNYEAIARKLGHTTFYPGNWLYEQWADSDLKDYLDTHGLPAPQPSTRDKLIASVRRNAYLASLNAKHAAASVSSSAAAAQSSLTEALFEAWSDSDFKKFFDEHGIHVPQGSTRNELIALARKHRAALLERVSSVSASATSAMGAATSKAGNQYARATDDARLKAEDEFDKAVSLWSDSRLKAFLDARGVPVPHRSSRDELLAKVRLHKHKAANRYSAWTFDTWTTDNLKKYLEKQNDKAAKNARASRDDLVKRAQDSYHSAAKAGGDRYASVTSYLTSATDAAKDRTFDTWSQSELKSYLDSYGIPTYQGTTANDLRAAVRRNANYFRYGTSNPPETIFARLRSGLDWLLDQVKLGASSGRVEGQKAASAAQSKGAEATSRLSDEL